MSPAIHRNRSRVLWPLMLAVGVVFVVGCDSSGDQPSATGKSETVTKSQNSMADFMKSQSKSATAKKR